MHWAPKPKGNQPLEALSMLNTPNSMTFSKQTIWLHTTLSPNLPSLTSTAQYLVNSPIYPNLLLRND